MMEKNYFVNREKIKMGNWEKENKGLIKIESRDIFFPDLGIPKQEKEIKDLREILQKIEKIEEKVKSLKQA